jgi:hypothetical protein
VPASFSKKSFDISFAGDATTHIALPQCTDLRRRTNTMNIGYFTRFNCALMHRLIINRGVGTR